MSDDHFTPPSASIARDLDMVYVGFWRRTFAMILDTLITMIVMLPLIYMIFGSEHFEPNNFSSMDPMGLLLEYVVPISITVFFWTVFKATPGKMALGCQIVNAKTGEKLGVGRSILRYLGYIISTIPLGLGFLWIVFDRRKQGWHDKIAGTVVIRKNT